MLGGATGSMIIAMQKDIALGLLTIPNLIALIALSPQVKKCSDEYWKQKSVK